MEDSDIEMFVAGAAARTTAEITGVNRNTVRVFLQRLRKLIASKLPCYELSGEWIVVLLSHTSFLAAVLLLKRVECVAQVRCVDLCATCVCPSGGW